MTGALNHHEIGQVTLLTNPVSGHGNAPRAAERALARLRQRGVDVVQIVGADAEHARRLVGDALDRGTDALVVAGGDGVITECLQALATTDIPLGIIPRVPATTTPASTKSPGGSGSRRRCRRRRLGGNR